MTTDDELTNFFARAECFGVRRSATGRIRRRELDAAFRLNHSTL
jgi:hypothetical protein